MTIFIGQSNALLQKSEGMTIYIGQSNALLQKKGGIHKHCTNQCIGGLDWYWKNTNQTSLGGQQVQNMGKS